MARLWVLVVFLTACTAGSTPSAPAVTKYDGTYGGDLALAQDPRFDSVCSPGRRDLTLTIRNGLVRFPYDPSADSIISGPVREDGTVNASGQVPLGVVTLSAKIGGSALTGKTVTSTGCIYDLAMRKR